MNMNRKTPFSLLEQSNKKFDCLGSGAQKLLSLEMFFFAVIKEVFSYDEELDIDIRLYSLDRRGK